MQQDGVESLQSDRESLEEKLSLLIILSLYDNISLSLSYYY